MLQDLCTAPTATCLPKALIKASKLSESAEADCSCRACSCVFTGEFTGEFTARGAEPELRVS